jgi:hypothetical protein
MPDRGQLRRSMAAAGAAVALMVLAGVVVRPDLGHADAALAVGLPPDVAKQGIAIGYALNYAKKEEAQAEALKRCREFRDAPQATRDLCKIVENFRDRCMAIALDPEIGTTGLGWSVAKKQEMAEEIAMDKCVDTAGKKRRDFCRITFTRCDRR